MRLLLWHLVLAFLGLAVVAGIAPVAASPPPSPPAWQVAISFFTGSSRLTYDDKEELDEVGLLMKQDPLLHCQSIGYITQTEPRGPRPFEHSLAERRSEAAKNYLITVQGIDPARITTTGQEDAPVESGMPGTAVLTLAEQ